VRNHIEIKLFSDIMFKNQFNQKFKLVIECSEIYFILLHVLLHSERLLYHIQEPIQP